MFLLHFDKEIINVPERDDFPDFLILAQRDSESALKPRHQIHHVETVEPQIFENRLFRREFLRRNFQYFDKRLVDGFCNFFPSHSSSRIFSYIFEQIKLALILLKAKVFFKKTPFLRTCRLQHLSESIAHVSFRYVPSVAAYSVRKHTITVTAK